MSQRKTPHGKSTDSQPPTQEQAEEIKPPDLDVSIEDQALIAHIMDAHGYESLKKTQSYAFNNGILEDGNYLLVADTGNGKTLTAEAVVLKHLQRGNRVAYLVPSRQLVWSKTKSIREWADRDYDIYSGSGKYRNADVAVGTFESFYQAIIRGVDGARSIDAIVLDDFHELYSSFRGNAIERSIAAALNGGIELYTISATIGNAEEIADWMDADALISPEGRQIPIREETIDASTSSTKEAVVEAVADNIDKGPFLVFCFAKSWTESRAAALAEAELFEGPSDGRNIRKELLSKVDGAFTSTHREILSMLRAGVGYVHADLPSDIKKYILELYEEGEIQAITTTTSLAYGFDSSVQTVIVADIKRRGNYVKCYEYTQWIGRAARPGWGYDLGYAYTLANDPETVEQEFFEPRELEDITTHVDNDTQFRWLVLELVANGWTNTTQIENFIKKTLYYHQMSNVSKWGRPLKPKDERLSARIRETADWLIDNDFLIESDTVAAFDTTALGDGAVKFHYNSWIDTDLISIKSFYNWVETTPHDEINQLDYLHKTIGTFDLALNEQDANETIEPHLEDYGYKPSKVSITAGLLRWYWMGNYSSERIERETEIDPAYIPSLAQRVSDTTEATRHIVEAAPDGHIHDWHDTLILRVEKGIRTDAVPLVDNIDGMGRTRVRNLRKYLQQMATQTLDTDPNKDLWMLLREFKDHTSTKNQFEVLLKEKVPTIGKVTANNISEFVDRYESDGKLNTSSEEYALRGRPSTSESQQSGGSNTKTDADTGANKSRADGPMSLNDF